MLKVGTYAKFTSYFAAILKVIILISKQKILDSLRYNAQNLIQIWGEK